MAGAFEVDDILAVEEPLEIQLVFGPNGSRTTKSISVTMRTPGHDSDLAVGFLFTEGIIHGIKDIIGVTSISENVVQIALHENIAPALTGLDRNFYTTSSCGVCGKTSLDAVRVAAPFERTQDHLQLSTSLIHQLPEKLREQQNIFDQTGGLHASALFDIHGELLLLYEDVGRHNALDKLVGAALQKGWLPLGNHLLLLSGRISFELVQKAVMAGIKVVAAVGAPSSLALTLALEHNITLIGFLRENRFNIYSGDQRIINGRLA